jgi:hypothetical protein
MKRSELRRHTPLRRTSELRRTGLLDSTEKPKQRKPLKRSKGISPASSEQRAKIAVHPFCVGCGREQTEYLAIDPAHLCDRSLGGCDDPDCVVGLCRDFVGNGCHREYDEHRLDLVPRLEPGWRKEAAHAVLHLGLAGAYMRLSNDRNVGRN